MQGAEIVTEFITGASWERLPSGARRAAQLALLDTLGAALAGTLTPVGGIAAEFARTCWPGQSATILHGATRSSAVGAAFANSYAANAIDIDDCALYTRGHPGAQIVPTALALAEAKALGGAETLTAVVVGYEIAHRAARIWHATHDVYQACGSWGSVACSAVASHLLRLHAKQTTHALGIADYHAPNLPMMRDIDHPAMVKHGVGWGAMTGILSAQLANAGFTGIPSLFHFEDYQDWITDIGDRYLIVDGLAWKRYACCAWNHAIISAAGRLVEDHGFHADDITEIRVETFHEARRLGTDLPTTTEEAQFSLAWPVAAYIVDGELGPSQMLEPALRREDIRELAQRISVVESEELNRLYQLASAGDPDGRYASKVTIDLRDGRSFVSDYVEGDINYPQDIWDAESLESKFRWLASHVLAERQVEQCIELLRGFGDLPDVRALTDVLAQKPRSMMSDTSGA